MSAALILFAVFATAVLSAVFGMAGGLVLMGMLALLLPVPAAMVAHGVVQSVSNGWRAVLLRRYVMWRTLAIYSAGSAMAALAMASVSVMLPKAWLFILLGVTPLLVWLPKHMLQLDARKPAQAVLCGVSVTGLNVLAGVSGPLLDVFFQNVEADRRAIVATKAATQVLSHLVKIAYYVAPALAAGAGPSPWLLAAAVPLSIAGTTLGARLLERLSEADFRKWTKRLVTGIGAVYVIRGLLLL